jgi:hypothetical protein
LRSARPLHAGGPFPELAGPPASYNRLLQALDRLGQEVQRAVDASVRESTALATLDAIDLGEERGMLWIDEAEARRAAYGEVDRR